MAGRLLALLGCLCLAGPSLGATPAPDEAQTAHARDLMGRMIAIRSVAGRGQVPHVAEMIAAELAAGGFRPDEIEIIPVGETVALIARFPGTGKGKPVVLSAHMDVVDARPEDWERDPYTMIEENGFLYGRGSIDNKFDLSVLVSTLARLRREGSQPQRDILLALSGDEESTMLSTRVVAERIGNPEFVLVADGEINSVKPDGTPLAFRVQAAEKTFASFRVATRNPGGHSSKPREDNAIYQLAHALVRIEQHAFPVLISPLTQAYMREMGALGQDEAAAAMRALGKNPDDAAARDWLNARPAYASMLRTTCVATLLEGGHAENALPQSATATVNCRILPGTRIDDVQAELARVVADPGVTVTLVERYPDAPASPLRPDVMAALRTAVDTFEPGLPIVPMLALGASDGLYFRARGIPSYALLSAFMPEADYFAHGLNERVPVAAIGPALRFWDTLIRAIARP